MNTWVHIGLTAVILLIITNIWLFYRVLRPLKQLAEKVGYLSDGELTALQTTCGGIPEIDILRRSMASMAGHVRRSQEEGYAYRNALTNGQEAERNRIAHELHDDTIQSLIAVAQGTDLASNWIEKDKTRAVAMLKTIRIQAVETADNLRRLIADLRPPALEELGLVPALKMLEKEVGEASIQLKVEGIQRRLTAAQELTLFRTAQETVRNARKHGQAAHILLHLHYHPGELHFTVEDDGIGFEVPARLSCLAEEGHFGLMGIYERVQSVNGRFHLASRLSQGTKIEVVLPVDVSEQPLEDVYDPVCGTLIHPQQAYGSTIYHDKHYYFCCPVCQGAFRRNPDSYLAVKPVKI